MCAYLYMERGINCKNKRNNLYFISSKIMLNNIRIND